MLLKMDFTNRSDQNSLHSPVVWQVVALWLNASRLWLENLIEFTGQALCGSYLLCIIVHSYIKLYRQAFGLTFFLEGKKPKDFNIWICYGVQWSVVVLLPISCFDLSPVLSFHNPHDTDPTSLLSLISFQHQIPGRARNSPLSRLILTDNCIYCFLFTSQ